MKFNKREIDLLLSSINERSLMLAKNIATRTLWQWGKEKEGTFVKDMFNSKEDFELFKKEANEANKLEMKELEILAEKLEEENF